MQPVTRNMMIALVLSGLVHLMFVSFKDIQSGLDNRQLQGGRLLQLELVESNHKEAADHSVVGKPVDKPAVDDADESRSELQTVNRKQDSEKITTRQQRQTAEKKIQEQRATDALVEQSRPRAEAVQQQVEQQAQADALSLHIHRAINRNKRYPYRARRQQREGVVRLSFVMHPDGQVSDVLVVHSSRFDVLDMAARQAVVSISPFTKAQQYLSYKHQYNIDIDFRLN